ncbi:pre-mrna-splicing factor 38b [Lichtheimia corymbifera JMRC:FSU:9682]|uniref:Pre-mRNA-splicing factor 38 n=1 Tax=Lichtheimia corymbifera JMRC:FSU:9682 TaxID=1263082 RepID=A0A068RMB9_9FUNG|nr:pre-mrna-splicing factor 38b [Lichtheimia corymbifera JMRC:FSU:9682]
MGKNQSNKLETWGNETTMNMNAILYQNILASPYFKSLYEKKTFHEIVDEIYNEVTNLAPFIKGTTVSTAFCCLFKFWTLRLTVKQLENLIDHRDSPYIRAIGFLYLRYVCAPAELWEWLSYYLEDEEEIELSGGPRPQKSTIGKLCRMLLTEQKFQGTMLPRIPVPIARDLDKKLKEYDEEMRNGGHGEYEAEEKEEKRSYERRRYDDEDEEEDRRSYRQVEMTAPMTEEIALMIEEIVPTTDGGMMIVDIIAEIAHVALMTEGGEETTMTIADPDTMMMTVTDAIDAVLVPGTDILLLDPTLVTAVDTSLDYFQPQSDYEKSDCDCREGSIKKLLVRCYSYLLTISHDSMIP